MWWCRMPPDHPILPDGSGRNAAVVEYRHVHISEDPDSIEVGTPGKGGCIKVYGDFGKPAAFREKIKAAYALKQYAAELLSGGGQ